MSMDVDPKNSNVNNPSNQSMNKPSSHRPDRPQGFVFPLLLVAVGGLLLLNNLGLLPEGFWINAQRFWPVIIILFGIELIFLRSGLWSIAGIAISLIIIAIVLGVSISGLAPWSTHVEGSGNVNYWPPFRIHLGDE